MWFTVFGRDQDTSQLLVLLVDATDEQAAGDAARRRGMYVDAILLSTDPAPTIAEPTPVPPEGRQYVDIPPFIIRIAPKRRWDLVLVLPLFMAFFTAFYAPPVTIWAGITLAAVILCYIVLRTTRAWLERIFRINPELLLHRVLTVCALVLWAVLLIIVGLSAQAFLREKAGANGPSFSFPDTPQVLLRADQDLAL